MKKVFHACGLTRNGPSSSSLVSDGRREAQWSRTEQLIRPQNSILRDCSDGLRDARVQNASGVNSFLSQ